MDRKNEENEPREVFEDVPLLGFVLFLYVLQHLRMIMAHDCPC